MGSERVRRRLDNKVILPLKERGANAEICSKQHEWADAARLFGENI